eukprot:2699393-Amphidinium_carterae.2
MASAPRRMLSGGTGARVLTMGTACVCTCVCACQGPQLSSSSSSWDALGGGGRISPMPSYMHSSNVLLSFCCVVNLVGAFFKLVCGRCAEVELAKPTLRRQCTDSSSDSIVSSRLRAANCALLAAAHAGIAVTTTPIHQSEYFTTCWQRALAWLIWLGRLVSSWGASASSISCSCCLSRGFLGRSGCVIL